MASLRRRSENHFGGLCWTHSVGSSTPLPEKPTKKVLFTGFIENQFIVVKTALGSDLINLSAFALK